MNIQKYKFAKSEKQEIWKNELRLILNRDIHEKGLGCCVKNTHIKIGNVHLEKFYEAQFLFGNSYWVSIFANALKEQIKDYGIDKNLKILIIGYETYIEPVLLQAKELLNDNGYKIDYCIYEEPKYILKDQKSKIRLRFSDSNNSLSDYDFFVLVCGISSTLSTFFQMISKISEIQKINCSEIVSATKCCSIIQVLPEEFEKASNSSCYFNLSENASSKDNILKYFPNEKCVERHISITEPKIIRSTFFVDVFCGWQNAQNCKWCFDELHERPIVTTNETSVIPVQMIGHKATECNSQNTPQKPLSLPQIDFFEKNSKGKFVYSDYLYYNHIERDNHHFQYYIRTNALLKHISTSDDGKQKLDNFCFAIKEHLFEKEKKNRIDIIVVPIHYSNEHFFNIINKKVFNGSAEIINFDPQKEYRSNFETKYSNYTYVFDNLKSKKNTKIYFHYVDDQIITGNTFYRAKSFVSSLLAHSNIILSKDQKLNDVSFFESVITVINRNSDSTKNNYVDDIEKYFSLFNIYVPSLRNHGDSCHLCSKSNNSQTIKTKSALFTMEKYWEEKETYHCIKTLEKAKELKSKQSTEICDRKFRQFYCENEIWKCLKNNWNNAEIIYKDLINLLSSEIQKQKNEMKYEYLISFVKVMAKPFIYYREEVKKAVHSILKYLIYILNSSPNIALRTVFSILKRTEFGCHKDTYEFIDKQIGSLSNRQMTFKFNEEKYYLYIIILSRLCSIGSSYLIKYKNIEKALMFYQKVIVENSIKNVIPIEEYIKAFIKTSTNGISGYYKAKKLDEEITSSIKKPEHIQLIQTIYWENLEAENLERKNLKNLFHGNISTRYKYKNILKTISPNESSCLFVQLHDNNEIFLLGKTFKDNRVIEYFSRNINNIFNENKDIIIESKCVFIKCLEHMQSFNKTDKIYFMVQLPKSYDPNAIRSLLYYRYELSSLLMEDLLSGAIKEVYQDKKWTEILAHPKMISHGQSEDIQEHLNSLEQKFELRSKYKDVNNQYSNIYSDITLFGNLLISFFYSKKIAEDRESKYKFAEDLKLQKVTQIIKFKDVKKEESSLDFSDYDLPYEVEDISKLFKTRFDFYINCLKEKNYNIKIEDEVLNKISGFISLKSNYEHSIWFTIAIIHILVKNALRHGKIGEEIILKFEKNKEGVDLLIRNTIEHHNWKNNVGITLNSLAFAFDGFDSSFKYGSQKTGKEYQVTITNFFNGGKV